MSFVSCGARFVLSSTMAFIFDGLICLEQRRRPVGCSAVAVGVLGAHLCRDTRGGAGNEARQAPDLGSGTRLTGRTSLGGTLASLR
jgi:hypothetical protein